MPALPGPARLVAGDAPDDPEAQGHRRSPGRHQDPHQRPHPGARRASQGRCQDGASQRTGCCVETGGRLISWNAMSSKQSMPGCENWVVNGYGSASACEPVSRPCSADFSAFEGPSSATWPAPSGRTTVGWPTRCSPMGVSWWSISVNPHASSRPSGRAAAARGWSALHGFAPTHGIKDYDLAYFDPDDLTDAWGAATQQRVRTVTTRSGASLPRGAALAGSVVKPSEDQPDRRHVRDRGNGQCGGRR
jgi:hypothetical protein